MEVTGIGQVSTFVAEESVGNELLLNGLQDTVDNPPPATGNVMTGRAPMFCAMRNQ